MNQNSLLLLVLNILNEKYTPEVVITSDIISQFIEYDLVFHFEEKTKHLVDEIVSSTDNDEIYMMNNYDYEISTNMIATRPSGYKFLHVVLLENYTLFDKFTNTRLFSLQTYDLLLFLNMQRSLDFTLWRGNILEQAGGLFVLNTWNLSLYTVCFFCGNLTKTLQKIDGLSIRKDNRTIDVPILRGLTHKFYNFNKHVFVVGYNIYKPLYFGPIVEQNGNHTVYEGIGIERELLIILSEKLNFICLMIPFFSHKSPWAAVVNAVAIKELDFAISGITLTLPRSNIVDFTSSIKTEPYSVLYSLYEDHWMAWKYILLPFQTYVWLVLAGTLLVISFLLGKTVEELSFIFFIQGWLRLLFEQSIPNMHSSLRTRWPVIFFMCVWFMFSVIINNSYKSKLTSSLIHSKAKEYETIDELVDEGYHFQINDFDSTVIRSNLQNSADSKFLEVLKRSNNDSDHCSSIFKTIGAKVAMIDELTLMQNKVQEMCRKLMSPFDQDQMRLLRNDIFPSTHAWAMQLNTPYRLQFNHMIHKINAAGLFVKWNSDFENKNKAQAVPRSYQIHTRLEAPSFNLASMLGPVIIWTVGVGLATLVFIGERIRRPQPQSPHSSHSHSAPQARPRR